MKESFKVFLERRMRNPLRKKELEGQPTNKEWIDQEKENLPDEEKEKLRRMKKFKVEPERIEAFRQGKIKEYQKKLESEYFKHKPEKPELILVRYGIKIFKDRYVTEDFSKGSYNYRMINNLINKLVLSYKDILPNRKPNFYITNTNENPETKGINIVGGKESPPGLAFGKIIYVDDFEILLHEYAHFLTFRIPKQIRPMLREEYKKMLNEYFGKNTRRESLEGRRNEKHRMAMAKKLGLPSDYATANFDEWFAELITHWKNMPNDKNTYRFKQILKKILMRI